MAGVPLIDLAADHLVKVINKLPDKSYFHLRQTCHAMDQVIRSRADISIHLSEGFYLSWDRVNTVCLFNLPNKQEKHKAELFYGTRLQSITPHLSASDLNEINEMEALCQCLKKHHVTCEVLFLQVDDWSMERCAMIIEELKPTTTTLFSVRSNRWEALLQSKTLKNVQLHLNPQDLDTVLPSLLSKFQRVTICVRLSSDQFEMLRTVIDIFQAQPDRPNLRGFSLSATWEGHPTAKELQQELGEYNLSIRATRPLGFSRDSNRLKESTKFEVRCPQIASPLAVNIIRNGLIVRYYVV